MNILILNGSPAPKGQTMVLIEEFRRQVDSAFAVKVVDCYRLRVKACIDCKYCYTHPGCSIKDDMQQIYEDVQAADAIVVATPMHFGICSAPLFTVFSRLQSYWAQRHIRKLPIAGEDKLGALLVSCGSRWLNMELVMDGVMTLAFDHMGVEEVLGRVYAKSTDKIPVAENEKALRQTRRLAEEINRRLL